jgi:hypothetical protein
VLAATIRACLCCVAFLPVRRLDERPTRTPAGKFIDAVAARLGHIEPNKPYLTNNCMKNEQARPIGSGAPMGGFHADFQGCQDMHKL